MSLKGVAKRIKGIHGRNDATGVTDYKTWDKFEEGVSLIWRNARHYNEDGSDMYTLANEFEVSHRQLSFVRYHPMLIGIRNISSRYSKTLNPRLMDRKVPRSSSADQSPR